MFYIWQAGEGGEGGRGGEREGRGEGGETTTMMTNKRLKPDLVPIQDRVLSKDISSEQIEVRYTDISVYIYRIYTDISVMGLSHHGSSWWLHSFSLCCSLLI